MGIFRSFTRGVTSPKVTNEDSAFAVAKLTMEFQKVEDIGHQSLVRDSLLYFARTALPNDPNAGLRLVQRVVQSNGIEVEDGGEWFAKSTLGKVQGLRSALLNSALMNIPSEVLYAKYIDRKFLNEQELTLLDSKSKLFNAENFVSGLKPRRYADFLFSKKLAFVHLELFHRYERLPISLSTLSTCFLIEWRSSEHRVRLEN